MPKRIRVVAWDGNGSIYDIWEFDLKRNKDGRFSSVFHTAMDHHLASLDRGDAVRLEIMEAPPCTSN